MPQPVERSVAHRTDMDWLRVIATYLLFVFHVAKVFDPAPFYHIRNHELSMVMLVIAGFISLWHMPLFFVLAGWSIQGSLRQRGGAPFVRERILRLWIPLVMGCVLLMPSIKYLELSGGLDLNHRGLRVAAELQDGFRSVIPSGLAIAPPFHESFREFLPTFFTNLDRFTWAHLWFLAYLFTFTVLYYPLFAWLLRDRDRFHDPHPLLLYVPALVLAAVQVTLRERWPGIQNLYDDWANVAFYSTLLIIGFLLARHPGLEQAVQREWRRALGIGLAVTLVLLLGVLGVIRSPFVILACTGIATWCFIVALLGFAHDQLSRTHRLLPYLAESALPVYLLHQSAIVLIGYPLIRLPLGITAKYVLLLAASLAATLGVYHFIVRRFTLTRLLFGMRARAARTIRSAQLARTAAALVLVLLAPTASFGNAAAPIGRWYAEGGAAQVEIYQCDDALCGRVVWLRSPFDENGCDWRDRHNASLSLRERAVVGLEILQGLRAAADAPDTWSGGTIYDPTSGRRYQALLHVNGPHRLELRGYWGIELLGRTTTWIRVGMENQMCAAQQL